ncbi:LOW QUALITY PROTEIN: phenylethanolamine N-methyltransferase-like [Spheniscus humboldti]
MLGPSAVVRSGGLLTGAHLGCRVREEDVGRRETFSAEWLDLELSTRPEEGAELGRWARGEPGTFDWSPFIRHVCKIEGRGEPWQEKERRLRDRLRRILPIDVHQPDPLGAPLRPPADALLSAFCLEAEPDRAAFARALAHVGSLLRPGGHALLLGALGESFYLAGAARLPVVPLAEDDVRAALAGAGFALRDFRSYAMPPALRTDVDDVDGVFFAHAQKPVET